MRKLVVALSLTTAAFAASTAYLARELREARASAKSIPVASDIVAELPARGPAVAHGASASASPTAQPSRPQTSDAGAGHPSPPDIQRSQADYARRFLAQLADPQGREELLAERKLMMRNSYPRLDKVLGLTAEEHAKLLELFARQQLDMQELHSRCAAQPECQEVSLSNYQDPHEREIADLLGSRQAKFETYRNSIGEREAVSQLSARLPDSLRLSDANAENLIVALADERNRLHQEAAERGIGMQGFGMGAGMIFAPEDGSSFETRYESARQSSQRLRERASAWLTPEQQRVFDEMQDETLMALRSQLRHKDDSSSTLTVVN